MIIVLSKEDIKTILNNELVKIKLLQDISAGVTVGIATQEFIDTMEEESEESTNEFER